MTKPLPLASHNCFASNDFDEAHARISSALMPHQLKPRGRPRSVSSFINRAELGSITFSVMRFGAAVTVRPGALSDFYIVHLPIIGEVSALIDGKSYRAGRGIGLALSPDVPLELDWAEGSVQLLVQIPRPLIEGRLNGMIGGGTRGAIRFRPDIDLCAPTGRGCAKLIDFLIDGLERNAFRMGSEDLERVLIHTLLGDLPHSHSDALWGSGTAKPYYIRRAEQFMLHNIEEPITIADIVRAVGVSERTLHAGFRRFAGTTPLRRLRALRLEKAHQALLTGRPGEVRVSDVAARYGMFQFGQFSALYKAAYGISPSATLRQEQ